MTGAADGTYVCEASLRTDLSRVRAAALDPEAWLHGWRHLRQLERVPTDGEARPRYRVRVRAVLPYTLSWEMELVRAEPQLLAWAADGDLTGAGTWHLSQRGEVTDVLSIWSVRASPRWMTLLWPVARPLFLRNHDAVMRRGAERLAAHLDAELLRCVVRGREG